jgi:hypothetical protein
VTDSTELTPIDRARTALSFSTTADRLKELAAKSTSITEVTNKAGRDQAHRAAMDLRDARLAIQRTGKDAREDARKYADAVVAAEKELVALVEPEEERLKALRDAWAEARAAERAEEERKERERIQVMIDAIAAINATPNRLFGASVDELTAAIDTLAARDMSDFDDVYLPNAQKAQADTIATLKDAREKRQALDDEAAAIAAAHEQQRIEREAEEARLAAERAKLEAEQAAAREAQAKADEEARLAREEADRVAAEERARQQAELDAQREALEAQQRALAEQRAAEEAERARQAEDAAQREREAREAQEQREAQERADREKQEAEGHRLSVQQAIIDAIKPFGYRSEQAVKLIEAIDQGHIPGLSITY